MEAADLVVVNKADGKEAAAAAVAPIPTHTSLFTSNEIFLIAF